MGEHAQPTDLELAALISSKICHDVIGPVGAIYNGLEILDEDEGAESKSYALDVIRNVTEQASARLQFARFAFGAAGSAVAMIDLGTAGSLETASTSSIGTACMAIWPRTRSNCCSILLHQPRRHFRAAAISTY